MNATGPLRALIAHSPPVTLVDDNGDRLLYSGFLVDLLPQLLQTAGINRDVEYVFMRAGSGGTRSPDGTWSGAMGYLTRKDVDFALFPLTLTQQRAIYIDYTPPFFSDGYGILKRKDEDTGDFSTFLKPFTGYTWLALICAMVFVGVLMFCLDKFTARVRRRTHERLSVERDVAQSKVHRHLFNSVVSFVGFGEEPHTASWSIRVLWLTWLIFSVIVMSAYTANLTAGLTVAQFTGGFQTLSQLKATGQRFAVVAQSSIAAYFETSVDSTARSMQNQMLPYKSEQRELAVRDVRDGHIGAYIGDYTQVQYYTQKKPCTLTVAKETFGPGQLVIGLPQKSSLTGSLAAAMLEMEETGVITELRRKWLVENSECPQSHVETDGTSLAITQVYSIFVLLGLGAGLAVCFAIGECLYFRHFFHHVHTRRQMSRSRAAERRLRYRQQYEEAQRAKSVAVEKTLGKSSSMESGYGTSDCAMQGAPSGDLSGDFVEERGGGSLSEAVLVDDLYQQQTVVQQIGAGGRGKFWRRREPQVEIGSASSVELSKGCEGTPDVGSLGVGAVGSSEQCRDLEVGGDGKNGSMGELAAGAGQGLGSSADEEGGVVDHQPRWYEVNSWWKSGHSTTGKKH